jgi:hypothetical protein
VVAAVQEAEDKFHLSWNYAEGVVVVCGGEQAGVQRERACHARDGIRYLWNNPLQQFCFLTDSQQACTAAKSGASRAPHSTRPPRYLPCCY